MKERNILPETNPPLQRKMWHTNIFADIKITSMWIHTGKFKSRNKANVLVRNCFWLVVTDINFIGISQENLIFSQWVSESRQLVALVLRMSDQGLSLHFSHGPNKATGAPVITFIFGQHKGGKSGHQDSFRSTTQQLFFIFHWLLLPMMESGHKVFSPFPVGLITQLWVSREEWENISKMRQKPWSNQILFRNLLRGKPTWG